MSAITYGYTKQLQHTTVADVIARLTDALRVEGFGILTEIDVRETLERKIHVDFRDYRILGACNPQLAHRALEIDPHIGLLLPCTIVVQQSNGSVDLAIADPKEMFRISGDARLLPIMGEADDRLRRVFEAM
jgi:uncharacterized protein (DUF302 family)